MAIHIRPAHNADVETLFVIRTGVDQKHQSREQLAALGITPETIAAALAGPARAWIAEVAGRAVAFSMVDVEEGIVFAVFVLPGFEDRGIGRVLMAEAEAFLFDHHKTIWLNTGAGEDIRANGFYRRLGWTADGTVLDNQIRYVKTRGG